MSKKSKYVVRNNNCYMFKINNKIEGIKIYYRYDNSILSKFNYVNNMFNGMNIQYIKLNYNYLDISRVIKN